MTKRLKLYHAPVPLTWLKYPQGSKPDRKGHFVVVIDVHQYTQATVAYYEGSEFLERKTARIDGSFDAKVRYFCPNPVNLP